MTQSHTKVQQFFARYERANADFDVQTIAELYAEDFMFADPEGVRPVHKSDFVKLLPRRKEFFRSLGLVSSVVASVALSELDAKYASVKVVWKMRFLTKAGKEIQSENSSTYILSIAGDSFEIVFQLDHQNLNTKAQELGLG